MKTALRVAVVISAMSLSGCASMDEKRMQLQGESTAARPESDKAIGRYRENAALHSRNRKIVQGHIRDWPVGRQYR